MSDLILPDHVIPVNDPKKTPFKVDFQIDTAIDDVTGTIIQETRQLHGDQIINHMRQVIDTQDAQVRTALIALGWTPPGESPSISGQDDERNRKMREVMRMIEEN